MVRRRLPFPARLIALMGAASLLGGSCGRSGLDDAPNADVDCSRLVCVETHCEDGFVAQTPQGACCPACASPTACVDGRQRYIAFRAAIVAKYQAACAVDPGCGFADEGNACASTCGIAIPVSFAAEVTTNLAAEAARDCAFCPPIRGALSCIIP